jgi:GT2 family glycosyltransferase
VCRATILIPVLGDPRQMEDTLVSVLENRPADCQIVVVLNQPYHDPYDLSGEVDFVEAPPGAGWSACVSAGIRAGAGRVVHVLHCAVEVEPGWLDAALGAMAEPDVAAVAPLVLSRYDERAVVAAGVAYGRSGRLRRLAAGGTPEQAVAPGAAAAFPDALSGFYRREAVEAVGGFCEALGEEAAAADLALRLRRAGYRTVVEPRSRVHARPAASFAAGAFRRGRDRERLFWRWADEHGRLLSTVAHLLLWLGLAAGAAVRPSRLLELLGRMLGAVESLAIPSRWRLPPRAAPPAPCRMPLDAAVACPPPPHFARRKPPVEPSKYARRAG